jgi:hypothetical protein
MDNMKHRRLQELGLSDFEVVEGEPDIRGWEVCLASGDRAGKVKELILDAQLKRVRYLVLDLQKNKLGLDDKEVLLPIGMAELRQDEDTVLLPAVQTVQLVQLPAYDRDALDHDMERRICVVLGRNESEMPVRKALPPSTTAEGSGQEGTGAYADGLAPEPDFYRHNYYEDDRLYRQRLSEKELERQQGLSEYDKGLRLWEKRNQAGTVKEVPPASEPTAGSRQGEEEKRPRRVLQPVRNNRQQGDGHRNSGSGGYGNRREEGRGQKRNDHTIEDRIRREGLQDEHGNM